MSWYCPLFEEPIKGYTYLQLGEWIQRCRNFILSNKYTDYSDYCNDVNKFCFEWEKHYTKFQKIYISEKFNKAILSLALQNIKTTVNWGDAKEDITNLYLNDVKYGSNLALAKEAEKTMNVYVLNYISKIHSCFKDNLNYKALLHGVIKSDTFDKVEREITFIVNKKQKPLKTTSYKKLLDEISNNSNITFKDKTYIKHNSYLSILSEYGIAKTVYNDFKNPYTCQKDFDKKFFINIAFALSLPYTYANKLLKLNGFGLKDSTRQFDIILEKAFRIGFGRQYTNAIINKYNEEEKSKNHKFIEVPNLDIIKRK